MADDVNAVQCGRHRVAVAYVRADETRPIRRRAGLRGRPKVKTGHRVTGGGEGFHHM
jgi:hypothetical protein